MFEFNDISKLAIKLIKTNEEVRTNLKHLVVIYQRLFQWEFITLLLTWMELNIV